MKVPVISMEDYEKSDQFMVRFTARTLVPDVIDKAHWGRYQDRIAHYPGLKEHIYLPDLNTGSLSRPEGKVIVILRPEAWTGHYYRRRSTRLLHRLIRHLGMNRSVKIIFLPRDLRQQAETEAIFRQLGISYETPPPGTYGFEIVARADLVIGGGGTMLREAACLGIPAYSYFAGERGDVDAYLEAAGRLHRIDTEADMERIRAVKRTQELDRPGLETRKYIVNFIEGFLLGRGVNADR
jgi:predicted glycosyltransferase